MNNSRYINALLALFSAIVCLIALELVVRWRLDIDLLTISDLRGGGVGVIESSQAAIFDANLGWTQRSFFKSDGFNTEEFGIRSNGGVRGMGSHYPRRRRSLYGWLRRQGT